MNLRCLSLRLCHERTWSKLTEGQMFREVSKLSEVNEWHTALCQVHVPPQRESPKLGHESSKARV